MLPIFYTESQIALILTKLGIHHASQVKNEWLSCLCVYHNDVNLGNAGINIKSGVFHCFSCGKTTNLVGVVKFLKKIDYKDALVFIGITHDIYFGASLEARRTRFTSKLKRPNRAKIESVPSNIMLKKEEFNPQDYYYTNIRGFTPLFQTQFNIKLCAWSEPYDQYKDYMIIPLSEDVFEARKLMEYEYLMEFFKSKRKFHVLQELFSTYKRTHHIRYKKGRIYAGDKEIHDEILRYLMKPKVLYPKNSRVNKTIFDLKNLDYNQDIYIVEGTGSLPKVREVFPNSTTIFGAAITPEQIDILNKFQKRKIFIPDQDEAGDNLLWGASQVLENVWVIPVTVEDTDESFIRKLTSTPNIEASRYLIRRYKILDFD